MITDTTSKWKIRSRSLALTLPSRYPDYLVALEYGAVCDWGPPFDAVTEEFLADVFDAAAAVENGTGTSPPVFPKQPLSE